MCLRKTNKKEIHERIKQLSQQCVEKNKREILVEKR